MSNQASVYTYQVKDILGVNVPLSKYKGEVLLIVNVASQCRFTPQYQGLELLYEKYKAQGFTVLGFPCNQFGGQEPDNETEIIKFCEINFGVKFPLYSKIEVNGPNADPLYQFLARERPGFLGSKKIKWNFTKFLVGRQGEVIKRFAPTSKPKDLEKEIQSAVSKDR